MEILILQRLTPHFVNSDFAKWGLLFSNNEKSTKKYTFS